MNQQALRAVTRYQSPERALGRRDPTSGRTSRDKLLAQFRQARRRLGATRR